MIISDVEIDARKILCNISFRRNSFDLILCRQTGFSGNFSRHLSGFCTRNCLFLCVIL